MLKSELAGDIAGNAQEAQVTSNKRTGGLHNNNYQKDSLSAARPPSLVTTDSANTLFSYMRSFLLALIASLCALSVLTSCSSSNALTADQAQQQPKSNSAEDFLKWSMDCYHALKSFQAQAAWNASYGKYPGPGETRDLSYISPNIFQAKTSMFNSMKMTAVSDGEHMVEYAEGPMQQG